MSIKLVNNGVTLYLSSEEQKYAAVEALRLLDKRPLLLVTVFESSEEADSFLESVNDYLLFNIQHPYDFAHQVDLLDLVDGMAAEIKGCLGK